MSKITKFEDIMAWRKARELTKNAYAHTKIGSFAKDFGLRDQGSCGEVKSHLYVALDQQYLTQTQFARLYNDADEVGRLLSGFMTCLRESNLRGRKFK